MKIEHQVCSYEQARKFKTLGVGVKEHSTFFCYFNNISDERDKYGNRQPIMYEANIETDSYAYSEYTGWIYEHYRYPAFTVSELGVMLADPLCLDRPNGYTCGYRLGKWQIEKDGKMIGFHHDHEAHVRAELLLIFLQEEIVTADELNKRLSA